MQLTVACQICGDILAQVSKDQITQDDISEYEANCFCNTVTNQVVDGQQDISTLVTNNG